MTSNGFQMVGRALRLRCPRCGGGALFNGWFRMQPQCDQCQLDFVREPGFYLGSIYVNYGLTAFIITGTYFAIFFSDVLSQQATLWSLTAFAVLFPLWFFRYARAVWLAFDEFSDPAAPAAQPSDLLP